MTGDLVFYTNPMSRGRIVRWMLEETGAPYRAEVVQFGAAMKSAAYLAVNPMGKVPAIRHRGAVVTEAAAICAYLADAFPEAGLAPPPAARAAYYRWLFFAAGPLEAATTNRFLGWEAPADKQAMLNGWLAQASNACVLMIGYSMTDMDIAARLYDIKKNNGGLHWYSVFPRTDNTVRKYWAERLRIRAIDRRFAEFMADLDDLMNFIPPEWKYDQISERQKQQLIQ